jgi:UDP:flavonoid glycosyltransferase YjiC (YdhE family)
LEFRLGAKVKKAPAVAGSPGFDVIVAGDMTRPGERSFRIAQEVRTYADRGWRVGLLQAASLKPSSRIASEVQTCVRRGVAHVVKSAEQQTVRLLVVHAPSEIDWSQPGLTGIEAEEAILVCHRAADFGVPRLTQRLKACADVQWVPTNPWLRTMARRNLRLMPDDWRPMLGAEASGALPRSRRGRARVGWIAGPGLPQPPDTATAEVVVLDEDTVSHMSLDRLSLFDGLAYFPTPNSEELLDTIVLAAAKMGLRIAAPSWLEPHYEDAAIYCTPDEAVNRLVGTLPRKSPTDVEHRDKRQPTEMRQRPVMFLASNGVGVGHVSRLLAIARRMDARAPLLFATQAQAVPAIERLGYHAEYLPSAAYVGGDFAVWDQWFRHDLENLIDAYDPALVVYDGNNPSDGLVRAVATRRDCRLAWIRRGMWGGLTSPFIDNSRWFDLVVEPGELEGQLDEGITSKRRDEAVLVPPIRLLDKEDLLSRAEAAGRLGLDPSRPSVLIQLGAGFNRDIISLVDHLITQLRQHAQLQVCIAEWLNGAQPLNYWPNVSYLRGYPLSQYFRAFDFSISAAGYNTFHEIVNFDLPTIFIPNRHPAMDDQASRATHAQSLHAAFELEESDLSDLPELVALLLDKKAREFLTTQSKTLHQPNGAADAARLLTQLLTAAQ